MVLSYLFVGWAFADSVLHRLAPLWVGARGLEFTWDYILQGLEANANLVRVLCHHCPSPGYSGSSEMADVFN